MTQHKYTRRGQHIESVERKTDGSPGPRWQHKYDSINKAKRKSRELQMDEDGALGLGCVRRHV